MKVRPTIRVRLAAWYASIFFVGGAFLLGSAYWIVSRNIAVYPKQVNAEVARRADPRFLRPISPSVVPALRAAVRAERSSAERTVGVRTRRRVAFAFLGVLGLTTVGSLLAGFLLAGRALRPIAAITDAARRVGETSLDERISLRGPNDELKELADTFDGMLQRLDRAFSSQRRFVANASHELTTPLAIMRAELDATLSDPVAGADELRAMAAVCADALERGTQLIASLLLLARSERGIERRDRVDLAGIARRVVSERAEAFRTANLRIEEHLAAAVVRGDAFLLERLAANLVDNALRYNHRGGFVAVETAITDGAANLSVSNSGPFIPDAQLPRLFEPFARLDDSRSRASGGSGLGLSIVHAIAEAHAGSARATARPYGGLDVLVTLERASPGAEDQGRRVTAEQTEQVAFPP